MASDITVKLAVDGEAEFKSALKAVNAQLKEMDSQISLTSSGMEDLDDAEEQAVELSEQLAQKFELQSQKIEILQQQYDKAKEKQEELRQKWEEAVQTEGESSEAAIKAGNAYNNQSVQVANLGTQLNNAQKALKDTAESQEALNEGQEEGNEGGLQMADIWSELTDIASNKLGVNIKGLGEKFESLTGLSAGTAAGIVAVAAAAKEFAEITNECIDAGAKYADDMNTLAKKTGVTTQSLQEMEYASELIDVSLDTFAGALKKTTKAMGEAQDGSSSYVETFEQLGVTWENTDGTLRDSEDVFYDIIEALRGMDNEAERDAAAQTLLGKSASELNPLIKTSAEDFQALREEAEESGYVLSQDMLDALNDVSDAEDRMDSATEALSNRWGALWAPIKTELVNIGTFGVQQITNLVEGIQGFGDKLEQLKQNSAFAWFSDFWENSFIPGAKIKNAISSVSSLVDIFNTLRGAGEDAADGNEEVAETTEDVADAADDVDDAYKHEASQTRYVSDATKETVEAYNEAHDAMLGITDACDEASGSGDELMKVYEEQAAIFEENAGTCDAYTQELAEAALQQLKFEATCQQLTEELPAIATNLEGIANTIVATGYSAEEWAESYNEAFDTVISGFDKLEYNTENGMAAWVAAMNQRNSIQTEWNSNMAYLTDCVTNASTHPYLSASPAMQTAIQTLMDGGVEEYGQVASEMAAAIQNGNYTEVQQILAGINAAGQAAQDAAVNAFSLATGVTVEKLNELIASGAATVVDGEYQITDAAAAMAAGVPEGIASASGDTSASVDSLVQTAGDTFLDGTAQQAFEYGGEALDQYTASGIAESAGDVTDAAVNAVSEAASEAQTEASTDGQTVGHWFDIGFANGIRYYSGVITSAAQSAARAAYDAACAELDVGSPSKKMFEVGKFYDQGFANGIASFEKTISNASTMVANSAVSSAKGTVGNTTNNSYGGNSYSINVYGGSASAQSIADSVMSEIRRTLVRA